MVLTRPSILNSHDILTISQTKVDLAAEGPEQAIDDHAPAHIPNTTPAKADLGAPSWSRKDREKSVTMTVSRQSQPKLALERN
jgi:hypothetical protein